MMAKEAMLRIRMSARDAHYGGNLVAGARMLELFFLAPVYSGDFIEARGRIVKVGNTSRRCEFEAHKVIAARTDISASAADVLKEPILVCRATGTTVVPAEMKRI
jgi:3-aminobutyryl-CoA ammonia-lyase